MTLEYQELEAQYNNLKLSDSFDHVCGFIMGLVACGIQAGNKEFNQTLSQFYNDDLALNGAMISIFTNLALEYELNFNAGSALNFPFDEKDDDVEILKGLGQFCYGLCLALGIKQQKKLNEDLQILTNIANIDTNSKMDVTDLFTIRKYLCELISGIRHNAI